MKKGVIAAVCALFFLVGTAGAGFAASLKCKVDSVEGETVTMTCDKADKLEAGDNLKVRVSKGAAIEGC